MCTTAGLSRRSVLGSLALSPVLVSPIHTTEASSGTGLLSLGRQFDVVAGRIDHAIKQGLDIAQDAVDQFNRIEAAIIATPATSIDGLRVKARAACWALLDDLDSGDQSTTDKRMALSIVRDLIRHYDPGPERPGASKKLVEDIESGAGNSVTHESTGSIG